MLCNAKICSVCTADAKLEVRQAVKDVQTYYTTTTEQSICCHSQTDLCDATFYCIVVHTEVDDQCGN